MKKITLLILLFILPFFVSAQNQERMSVHYFDVPGELVQDFLDFHKKRDLMLEEAGFGKDLYKLYKVKDSDTAKKHRYFMISQYTSDKHYKMTHDVSPEYEALIESFWNSDMAKIFPMDDKNHIYRKVYRIE